MTSSRIYIFASLASVTLVSIGYFWLFEEGKKLWTITGGEPGGHYDAGARAIAEMLHKSNHWDLKVLESSGSVENLERLEGGQSDLCLVQNDFPGRENIRAIATVYEEVLHVIIPENNVTIEDLVGATISVGKAGGGTEPLAKATFAQLGLSEEMATWRREGLREGLKGLREGKSKAVCIVTGIGNKVLAEALSKGDLRLLSLGEEPGAILAKTHPFTKPAYIPAKSYPVSPGKGLPQSPVPTIGTRVILACRANLAESHVLELTRSLAEGRTILASTEPLLAQITPIDDKSDIQFPLHEGARQYYERDEPSFLQNWSEPIALLLSVLAIAWGIAVAIRELLLKRRKESLDVYFKQVDELTTELVEGVSVVRANEIAKDLHAIRRETTRKLIAEELAANESFVIFQRQLQTTQHLVSESFRKEEPEIIETKG